MRAHLPPELWQRIADHAPHNDRRALLRVSRVLHGVGLRLLFAKVVVQFGLWERLRSHSSADTDEDEDEDDDYLPRMSKNTAQRTEGLLEHIVANAAFAHVVRDLQVLSYSFDDNNNVARHTLLAAIRALPHLRSFGWFGNFPHISLTVVQALNESCPDLRTLRIPATHAARVVPGSFTLHKLDALIIVCQLDIDNMHGYVPELVAECRPELQRLIHANKLVRLAIYSDLLPDLAPPAFERLQDLEIWGPRNAHLNALDRLLPLFSRLEYLALIEITHCQDVMPLLQRHAQAFGRLVRLKLMSIDPVHSEDTVNSLSSFITAQSRLCWLDLDLPGLKREHMLVLLQCIPKLPRLEVLGLDCRSTFDLDDMPLIADALPQSLLAFHLQLSFENVPLSNPNMQVLVGALSNMWNLRFLHIQTMYMTQEDVADNLAFALPCAQVLGLGEVLWDVEREDSYLNLRRWSYREVALRSVDTLCEEAEWVLRFHNLLSDSYA